MLTAASPAELVESTWQKEPEPITEEDKRVREIKRNHKKLDYFL
jgi:hypothetical protein